MGGCALTDIIDFENLTPSQQARYEWALAEYNRIQERNSAPGMTTIAPGISPLIKHRPNPKSRLFARLLEGKPPLSAPPPTSFSYPWYELIEDGFSENVSLDGFTDSFGDPPHRGIRLNQAVWKIILHNAAAKSLMAFSLKVAKTKSMVLNPHESLETKKILEEKPEWVVQHGRNPEFRLYLCRVKRRGRKDLLMTGLLQRDFSGGNPKLIQKIEPVQAAPKPAFAASNLLAPKDREGLTQRIADVEREMAATGGRMEHEWVVVECDAWCLELAS
jgi:hypothetical protein